MDYDLGIVIPAYDPDPDRLISYLVDLDRHIQPAQLHVELDTPSTGTMEALSDSPASFNTAHSRRGKGAAITAGFDYLETDILAFVDADGSTPPESLEAVVEPIQTGDADLSVGSRRHPDANVTRHQTRIRRRLGDGFVSVAQLVLPVHLYDYQCGAKAITSSLWEEIREELVSPGFAWDIEFVTIGAVLGNRLVEVPITWEDQAGTTVPVLGTTSAFVIALLRARHRAACLENNRCHLRLSRMCGSSGSIVSKPSYGNTDVNEQ